MKRRGSLNLDILTPKKPKALPALPSWAEGAGGGEEDAIDADPGPERAASSLAIVAAAPRATAPQTPSTVITGASAPATAPVTAGGGVADAAGKLLAKLGASKATLKAVKDTREASGSEAGSSAEGEPEKPRETRGRPKKHKKVEDGKHKKKEEKKAKKDKKSKKHTKEKKEHDLDGPHYEVKDGAVVVFDGDGKVTKKMKFANKGDSPSGTSCGFCYMHDVCGICVIFIIDCYICIYMYIYIYIYYFIIIHRIFRVTLILQCCVFDSTITTYRH